MSQAVSQAMTIGQIALTVRDLNRAVAFYRDTLGLKMLFEVPNMGFFDCGGIRLMLSLPLGLPQGSEESFGAGSVIYFKIEDIEQEAEKMRSRGVAFEQPPHLVARMPDHELWMAFFRDPDANLLALMCEKR
jgi:methylmalonyl-CoA/ethylmalonyl-CoA epimerase